MFAIRLKRSRTSHGWSQGYLAELSGVSQAYISELEAGEKQPTLPIVEKLAKALGVHIAELLEEEAEDG
ncbi:helix-turn-helix domain-containing protein [Candidatus Formimonas warabiya]|uniref:Transcriptional regulator n=1 Tax=Formimonas warabiya TaxID=1761012 RepID=A0A3G1KWK2_FORW1|nr:helix-turn-helix transcriptional regulator [Candidatus Formimonas warabiya]ATW26749.1 transcriptional regulator [Candidatus Formimonas warabiya]